MRARRPLLVLSLPVALALSACTGAGTPAPSTGIDVGTAASSQSPGPSGASTPASTAAPSTTASGASQPKLAWADGTAVAWGKPISPKSSTPKVVGTIAKVIDGSSPLPWGFVDGKLLSSQQPADAFDGDAFQKYPVLALGTRSLGTSEAVKGSEPGQVLAATANTKMAVWVESPSAQAGADDYTIYQRKLDGSAPKKVSLMALEEDDALPFTGTRVVLAGTALVYVTGMAAERQIVANLMEGGTQTAFPAAPNTEVWAAGGENTVMWAEREDSQIQIKRTVFANSGSFESTAVLAAPEDASGQGLSLLAASGDHALVSVGDTVAVLDLEAQTLREVSGIKASALDLGTVGGGGGRLAVHMKSDGASGFQVLSVAPDGKVELLTLPATEGGLAVDSNRIAVTSTDKQLTVVRVS